MKRVLLALAVVCSLVLVGVSASAHNPHKVKRGETLSEIAGKHNTSVRKLMRKNRHIKNPNLIYPGQKIKIRGKNKPGKPDKPRKKRNGKPATCQRPHGQLNLPASPVILTQGYSGPYPLHSGIDIANPQGLNGQTVRSMARGRVTRVLHLTYSYGVHVVIRHACGVETLYAHLLSENVFVGERVRRGEVIGRMDSTGNSTGPHVHLEIRQNGRTVNPAPWIWGTGGGTGGAINPSLGRDFGHMLVEPPKGGRVVFDGPPRRRAPWSVWWRRIAFCESTLRWHINTGNGYYGGLQFWPPTWWEHGGRQFAEWPHHATVRQQKRVAERVLRTQGLGAWPVCGPLGLK